MLPPFSADFLNLRYAYPQGYVRWSQEVRETKGATADIDRWIEHWRKYFNLTMLTIRTNCSIDERSFYFKSNCFLEKTCAPEFYFLNLIQYH